MENQERLKKATKAAEEVLEYLQDAQEQNKIVAKELLRWLEVNRCFLYPLKAIFNAMGVASLEEENKLVKVLKDINKMIEEVLVKR